MIQSFLKIPYLRLKYRFFPNEAQKFWAQELLSSYGITAKFGQIILQGTRSHSPKPSLSHFEAKKILKSSFQAEVEIEPEVYTASMGQVFRAKINGKKFAVKILHPDIKSKIKKEIDHVILLGSFYARANNFAFDKNMFKRFLNEVFEKETDLIKEGQSQKQFKTLFTDVLIPDVVSSYSNELVLTQELVESTLARDLKDIQDFAIIGFFFRSLLEFGILHGDLNDRNWGYHNGKLVVYDFGCTQVISKRRRDGLRKLLLNQDLKNAFQEFGVRLEATTFKNREQELRDAIFLPFTRVIPSEHTFDLQKQFGQDIKKLREFCDPWILLMMRSLFSIIKVYQTRNIEIPMGTILLPLLGPLQKSEIPTMIRIEVTEDGKQIVSLHFSMTELNDLPFLIPSNVLEKISANGINLKEIIHRTSKETPTVLFQLELPPRTYKVWTE